VAAVVLALAVTLAGTGGVAMAAGETAGVVRGEQPGLLEAVLFYLVATGVVISVLGICLSRSVVRMAVWLFVTLGLVALLYFLLAATFLGAIQLIVYVGGTLVLLVFGVMLTSRSPWARYNCRAWELYGAGVVCLVLLVSLCLLLGRAEWVGTQATTPGVPVARIGEVLLSKYVLPFEAAGVLLFIVMVGAAHLARDTKK